MAVAFGSIQSAQDSGANITSITVTKPTGLAEGDLMVAVVGGVDGTDDWTLTGWTEVDSTFYVASSRTTSYVLLAKVASSGDAAASNFTFSGSTANAVGAAIMRFTGDEFGGTANILSDRDTSDTFSETSETFTGGVTPTQTNTLLVMGVVTGGDNGDTPAIDDYSVANNDPTWTERLEQDINNNTNTSESVIALATGTYSPASATGDYTLTLSGGAHVNAIGFLLSISESVSSTFNADPLVISSTLPNPTVTGDANVTATPLVITSTLPNATVTGQQNTVWTPEDEPDDAGWTNESLI